MNLPKWLAMLIEAQALTDNASIRHYLWGLAESFSDAGNPSRANTCRSAICLFLD